MAIPSRARGFTLIEVMIVVVIVGILAAIALPSYFQYIQRSKIVEATTGLSDYRTRMEQFFLDNRKYTGGCTQYHDSIQAQVKAFTLTCADADTTYTVTATGKSSEGMDSAFVYTVNQQGAKTSAGPTGWTSSSTCWAVRKDGSCL